MGFSLRQWLKAVITKSNAISDLPAHANHPPLPGSSADHLVVNDQRGGEYITFCRRSRHANGGISFVLHEVTITG
jgi:hypothetical protein